MLIQSSLGSRENEVDEKWIQFVDDDVLASESFAS